VALVISPDQLYLKTDFSGSTQRRRLAAGLAFEKRRAQLQNQVKKLNF